MLGTPDLRLPSFGKEKGDRSFKHLRNLRKPAGAHAIGAFFVLLNLLKCQPKRLRQIGLRHRQFLSAQSDELADFNVDRMRGWRAFHSHCFIHSGMRRLSNRETTWMVPVRCAPVATCIAEQYWGPARKR